MPRIRIPVVGQATAGRPSEFLPIEGWREIRPVPGSNTTDSFAAILVVGDSLRYDGIVDQDWAIFRLCYEANVGDLVIARTPYGYTIKYLYPDAEDNQRVWLRSANPDFQDQSYDWDDVFIIGVVVRIERDMAA